MEITDINVVSERSSQGSLREVQDETTETILSGLPANGSLNPVEQTEASVDGLAAKRATILIVEDDTEVREIMSEILRQSDYHVLNASGGTEALEISRQYSGSLELVLTDLVMPEMDGLELVERLRKVDGDLKVIYMSGYGTHRDADHGSRDPSIPMIQKPIRAAGLIRLVREVLGHGKAPPD
jgi:two-component system cell cycle sensor histidine kinase/response regulator CckA